MVAIGFGVLVVAALLVAKWVNRHEDKQNNGGHHQLICRAEIRLPFPGTE